MIGLFAADREWHRPRYRERGKRSPPMDPTNGTLIRHTFIHCHRTTTSRYADCEPNT
jgi:hypothetical protein